jgi:hypothetical protein
MYTDILNLCDGNLRCRNVTMCVSVVLQTIIQITTMVKITNLYLTNFNKLTCICWYHCCIYSNNARIMDHLSK